MVAKLGSGEVDAESRSQDRVDPQRILTGLAIPPVLPGVRCGLSSRLGFAHITWSPWRVDRELVKHRRSGRPRPRTGAAAPEEAKALLLEMQRQILSRQIAAFLASHVGCPCCGRGRGIEDHKTILVRTLFGKLELVSPRLRRCPCQHTGQASTSPLVELLSEHAAPELLYLESKWSALVPDRRVSRSSSQNLSRWSKRPRLGADRGQPTPLSLRSSASCRRGW